MTIYTRKELDKKSTAYIVARIADGYIISSHEISKVVHNNFVTLEKKDGEDIVWRESIGYGIDYKDDYRFRAEVYLNGKRQNIFNRVYHAIDSNTFSD